MRKLLMVDDNPDLIDLMREELAAQGVDVKATLSGKEALRELGSWEPDLILLDVRMPEMSGPEFLDACEKHFPALVEEVPVVYSSAGKPPPDPRVVGFIDKMVDLSEYLAKVRAFLDQGPRLRRRSA